MARQPWPRLALPKDYEGGALVNLETFNNTRGTDLLASFQMLQPVRGAYVRVRWSESVVNLGKKDSNLYIKN